MAATASSGHACKAIGHFDRHGQRRSGRPFTNAVCVVFAPKAWATANRAGLAHSAQGHQPGVAEIQGRMVDEISDGGRHVTRRPVSTAIAVGTLPCNQSYRARQSGTRRRERSASPGQLFNSGGFRFKEIWRHSLEIFRLTPHISRSSISDSVNASCVSRSVAHRAPLRSRRHRSAAGQSRNCPSSLRKGGQPLYSFLQWKPQPPPDCAMPYLLSERCQRERAIGHMYGSIGI